MTKWCRANGVDQGWASNILKTTPHGMRARQLRRQMMNNSGAYALAQATSPDA